MGRNCESGLIDCNYLKRYLSNILCTKYVNYLLFLVCFTALCKLYLSGYMYIIVYSQVISLNGFISCLFTTNSSTIGSIMVQPIVWVLQVSSLVINELYNGR